MGITIDEAMDELQEGLDYSYIGAVVQGKQLTKEQHKAKERTLINLIISETTEHEARLQELWQKQDC